MMSLRGNTLRNSSLASTVSLDLETSWAAKSWDSARYWLQRENQARFQQKLLQDKEQKILSLYANEEPQTLSAFGRLSAEFPEVPGGRVRQLFKERRVAKGPGWDKSNPLQPLDGHRSISLERTVHSERDLRHIREDPRDHQLYSRFEQSRWQQPRPAVFEDKADYLYQQAQDTPSVFKKLPNIGRSTAIHKDNSELLMEPVKQTAATVKRPSAVRMTPQVASLTKAMGRLTTAQKPEVKRPSITTRAKLPARQPNISATQSSPSPPRTHPSSPQRPTSSVTTSIKFNPTATPNGLAPAAKAMSTPKLRKPTAPRPPASTVTGAASAAVLKLDCVQCGVCKRSFAKDRIDAHERICAKTSKKKRKVFDPVKHRTQGTEAELYLHKGKSAQPPPPLTKSNWRSKHEEFISNIRAAKQVQMHLAKGGKLSDLPPPPPMDTSDLTPCPHCGRKFNDTAAQRHIPQCANFQHNKTKRPLPAKTPARR